MYYTINEESCHYDTFTEAILTYMRRPMTVYYETISCKDDNGLVQWRVGTAGSQLTDEYIQSYDDYDNMSTADLLTFLSWQVEKCESGLYILIERDQDAGFDIREVEDYNLEAVFLEYREQLIEDYEQDYGESCLDDSGDIVEGVDIPDRLCDMDESDVFEYLLPKLAEEYDYPYFVYEEAAAFLGVELKVR